jgi:hypothetical protein
LPPFVALLLLALVSRLGLPAAPTATERTTADGIYTAA